MNDSKNNSESMDLYKLAADTIRTLKKENDLLKAENSHIKSAAALAFKMFDDGNVAAENLESLFNKLSQKTDQELEIFEKAAELQITADILEFGRVSDRPDLDGLDPLTRLLLEDY